MTQGFLTELLTRLNGKSFEKHDIKTIFAVRYFEVLDDGSAKVILKPTDNPDYDPQYWEKIKAEQKANEQGARNESN